MAVHIAVVLLLACITLSLVVRGIFILRFLRNGPAAKIREWYLKLRGALCKVKQDEERPKRALKFKESLHNKTSRVPVMPPAHGPPSSGPLLNQVDDNVLDAEYGCS